MTPVPVWLLRIVVLALVLAALSLSARAESLYQSRAVVTGQVEETRIPGIRECFVQVLAKVSGDARLIDDPRTAALAEGAGALVTEFSYRDRMAGIPVHDEQGTYDRPYDLIVSFDPVRIDAGLRALGREPWTAPRPRLAVFVAVRNPAGPFVLVEDSDRGADMRRALSAAADLGGLNVTLPQAEVLAGAGLGPDTLTTATPAALHRATEAVGGDHALAGTLAWSDADMGWIAEWRIKVDGDEFRWGVRGVSFDGAFRNALRGAAQILSGNGAPG